MNNQGVKTSMIKTDITILGNDEPRNEDITRFCQLAAGKLRPRLPEGLELIRVEVVATHNTPINAPGYDFCKIVFHCKSPGCKVGAKGLLSVFSEEVRLSSSDVHAFVEQHAPYLVVEDFEVLPDYDQTVGDSNYFGTSLWFQLMEREHGAITS